MARNGSGNYSLPSNSWNPAVPNTAITSDDWNQTAADIALALTQSIASDGQTTTTARIPFSQGISLAAGSVTAPAISIIGDTNTGFYAPAVDEIAIAINGVQTARFTATSIILAQPITLTGGLTLSGALVANGSITLGDAAGDALTVNATSTFSAPATFNGTVTVPNASFTNAKLANMATQTIKGRTTAGTGAPEDLTATQATAILNAVVGDSGSGGTKGLVPAPAAGSAAKKQYLDASGTFSNEIYAWGLFTGSTGATVVARNMSVTRTNIGRYTIAFGTAVGSTNYAILISTAGDPNFSYEPYILNKASGGFDIETAKNSAGTGTYYDPPTFSIQVLA